MKKESVTAAPNTDSPIRYGIRRRLVLATVTLTGLMVGVALLSYAILANLEIRMALLASSNLDEISRAVEAHNESKALMKLIDQLARARTRVELDSVAAEAAALLARLHTHEAHLRRLLAGSTGEIGALLTQIKSRLEETGRAVHDLETLRRQTLISREQRIAVGKEIDRRFSALFTVAIQVDAHMRALASRALAIDLPTDAKTSRLQRRLDLFLEREISWLGTAQDLLTVARELHNLSGKVQLTEDETELTRLQQQIDIYTIRLRVYQRLPNSGAVKKLPAVVNALVTPIRGKSGLVALRVNELDLAARAVKRAGVTISAAEALETTTETLLPKLVYHTHKTVSDTQGDIRNAQFVLFVAMLAMLLFIYLAFTRYIGRRIIRRLENFTSALKDAAVDASSEKSTGWDAGPVDALSVGKRDEVTAMGESLEVFRNVIVKREKALRESEERYRAIAEDTPVLVYRFLPCGEITYVNDTYCRYFEKIPEELVGNTFARLIHEEDRKFVVRNIESLTVDSPIQWHEHRVITRGGMTRWLHSTNRALFDNEGNLTGYHSLAEDISDRKRAEAEIKAALEEKNVLLREVHHRVKNHMQVIYSLLNLQARRTRNGEVSDALRESQLRVRSMGLAHEVLYRSNDFSQLMLSDFISRLVTSVQQMFTVTSNRVTVQTRVANLRVSMDQAIPLGLIINELVTNALKYAFEGERTGTLRVSLEPRGDREAILTVSDDGIGLPEDLDWQDTDTLGLVLVSDLCRQIRGTVSLDRSHGVCWKIVFKAGPS